SCPEHEAELVFGHHVGSRGHAVRGGDQQVGDCEEPRAGLLIDRFQLVRRNPRRGLRPGRRRHAGTCWLKRVSTMWSAARSASATIVEVGLTPEEVTKQLPSTTYRFGTSWARFHRSSTDVSGSSPIRAVPRRCQPE